jgi:methionine-rich copper-binding protein CopC
MSVTRAPRRARLLGPLLGALLAAAVALPAAAHAEFVSSTPAKGATVPQTSTLTVVINFSAALKSTSKAEIFGPDQALAGTAKVDPKNNKRLTWTSPLQPAAGAWTVKWTSVATDNDVLRGEFTFNVSGAAPSASVTAPPKATPTPTPAPTAPASADSGSLLPIVAALVAIAVLGLVLLRSRRPASRR